MKHQYLGQVYLDEKSGKKKIKLLNPDQFPLDLQKYDENDRVVLKLETFYRTRTGKQNSVFHMYCGVIAEETGYELEEIKELIKGMRLKTAMLDKDGNEVIDAQTGECVMVVRKTSKISTVEMVDLCDWTRTWAMSMFGIDLPIPDANWKLQLK